MTRRPGRSTSNDPGLAALLEAKADAICFVAKSWDYQVRVALETTNEENLASIRDSVKAAKAAGREVLLDCEHFFDGYKANPNSRWPAPRRPTSPARAGWCCATPMAAPCRTRSRPSSARW
jgi:isopropylmalate/homocitrate/citramalate synthase